MKKQKIEKPKDWDIENAKTDAEDSQGICKEEYDRIFSELSEIEQKERLGEKLYWVDGIWIYPDGTTEDENTL